MSKSGIYKDVWDKRINVNPENFYGPLYSDIILSLQRVQSEDFVRIGDVSYLLLVLTKENTCDVTVSSDRFFKSNFAFPTYKGFPYLRMFNQR